MYKLGCKWPEAPNIAEESNVLANSWMFCFKA